MDEVRGSVRTSYSNIAASDQARLHLGDVYNVSNTFALHCRRTLAVGSAEGIRLTTCVSGLRDLTDNLVERVLSIQPQPGPSFALPRDLVHGLVESQVTLTQLESQLRNISRISQERASLIQADHWIISFTHAILLFSEIQKYLQYLDDPDLGSTGRAHDKLEPTNLAQRLSSQCSTWRSQLEQLQCPTEEQAHSEALVLEVLTSKLLTENGDLKRRMDSIEREVAELAQEKTLAQNDYRHSLENIRELEKSGHTNLDLWKFEEVLHESWVYKRNEHREEVMSFSSSIGRDDAWSELSKLTLAHLSVISVIALPVKASELTDSSWYQKDITIAAKAMRSRTPGKARLYDSRPRPSQDSKPGFDVSVSSTELWRVDDGEWRAIRTIDLIALAIRRTDDESVKHSLELAELRLSKALNDFKVSKRLNPSLNPSTSSPLIAELNSARSLLSACGRREDVALRQKLGTRAAPLAVKGILRGLTKSIIREDKDVAKNAQKRQAVEPHLVDQKAPRQESESKHLDGRVFLCEGFSALDLSDKSLSILPYEELQSMTNTLHILVLDGNRLSGLSETEESRNIKASLDHVKVLLIRRNGLMQFPKSLLQLRLNSLDVSHNYIESIPPQVSEMPELQELAVQGNSFTELPPEVWRMESLGKLYVQWTAWRAWCEVNEQNVEWKVVERFDVGLYATGWVELERNRFPLHEKP